MFIFFFFNDTATTEIYTLSLHDALPIFRRLRHPAGLDELVDVARHARGAHALALGELVDADPGRVLDRDEERDLARRDPDGPRLAAQLPAEPEEGGPQPVREGDGVGGLARVRRRRHIVNQVNDSAR